MKKFKNIIDTVVVTGASSAIGEACALSLDKKGFQVFAGVRDESDVEKLKTKTLGNLIPVFMDPDDAQSLTSMLTIVTNVVGNSGIIGLVNNAEVAFGGTLELIELPTLRQQLETNVIGQIKVTQKFLPLLRLGKGRIVNIRSINGRLAEMILGPHSAFKHAMDALTDSLRVELKPWNISVSTIEPGSVFTPIWEKSFMIIKEYIAGLSPEERSFFDERLEPFLPVVDKITKAGISTEVIAKALIHAIVAKKPKIRYLLGSDAKVNVEWNIPLPDRIRQILIATITGIPEKTDHEYIITPFETDTTLIKQVS